MNATDAEPTRLPIHGGEMFIDSDDLPLVRGLNIYVGNTGYAYYSCNHGGRSHVRTLHSLLMGTARGKHVDHINGDKLDNRRANLRLVPIMLNHANRHVRNRNNTSGARGVVFVPNASRKKPWRAQITKAYRNISIGYYATKDEAIAARREAELRYFGELCPEI